MNRSLYERIRRLLIADPPTPPRPCFRPTLERLEDRLTPSVAFAGQVTFGVGAAPESVAVGDFNGDGRSDFAVVNQSVGTVSVLLNTTPAGATAPTFAGQVTFAVGAVPTSVAVGDFNGDGKPDLAVANFSSNTVSVLLNTTPAGATAPSFAPQVTFAVGSLPDSVAVGDFNGDGKPDLVTANLNDETVSVLLDATPAGATAPTFAGQVTFAVGVSPTSVAFGDFNGDGKPDLVTANEDANTVSVLLNTAAAGATAPSFAAQQTFAVGAAPVSVAVGDFNGDGRPDLVVANEGDNTASVLPNTTAARATAPSFAAQATFAVGSGPFSVAAADFNGDGRPDLAVANELENTASVLLNTSTPFAVTGPVLVADLHGMGVVEYNRLTGQWVQLNPGNPSDVSLLAADPQGDVFADYPGCGVFRYTPSLGFWQMVNGTDAVAIATDVRGDLFASFTGAGVGLFRQDGSSKLLTPVAAALLSSNANGDLVGDFTGYGVHRRTAFSGVWVQVNGVDAQAVAIDRAGDVFASFNGAGIGEFRLDGSASLLTTSAASALAADAAGGVTATIPGLGVEEFTPPLRRPSPQRRRRRASGDGRRRLRLRRLRRLRCLRVRPHPWLASRQRRRRDAAGRDVSGRPRPTVRYRVGLSALVGGWPRSCVLQAASCSLHEASGRRPPAHYRKRLKRHLLTLSRRLAPPLPAVGRPRPGGNDVGRMGLALLARAASAASRLLSRGRPRPIGGRLRCLGEVAAVAAMGYEIVFRRVRATKTYQSYAFWARRRGRTVGRLDVDFIESRKWLYVANIYVVESHGDRGVGTALLVCAARRTACTVLTTSSRTRQGAAFFAKNRATLKRYGVEMVDRPPAPTLLA